MLIFSNSRYAQSIPAVPLFVKVADISLFSAIILFDLINELGKINLIRNLITGARKYRHLFYKSVCSSQSKF